MNFQMFKLDVEKAAEPEIKFPTSMDHRTKQDGSRKISTSALLTMPKLLTVWITKKLWNILQETGISDHLTYLLKILYAGEEVTVRIGHWIGSKSEKEYTKAVYCYPAYLTYTQSTS